MSLKNEVCQGFLDDVLMHYQEHAFIFHFASMIISQFIFCFGNVAFDQVHARFLHEIRASEVQNTLFLLIVASF